MRLEYLQYLIEVEKHSSMSEAGRALHLTTPALSIALNKLEDELGVKLINTDNKGTELTEAGRELAEKSREFFSFLDSLSGRDNSKQSMTINILASYGIRDDFIMPFLKLAHEKLPQLEIKMEYMLSEAVHDEFLNGIYDVALFYNTRINGKFAFDIPSELEFVPLFKSHLYCVAHKESVAAKYKTISLKTLARLKIPLIVSIEQKEATLNLLSHFTSIPKIEVLQSYLLFQKMLSNNMGVALSSLSAVSAANKPITLAEDCVPIKISDDIAIYLGYLIKEGEHSQVLDTFLEFLTEYIHAQNK